MGIVPRTRLGHRIVSIVVTAAIVALIVRRVPLSAVHAALQDVGKMPLEVSDAVGGVPFRVQQR